MVLQLECPAIYHVWELMFTNPPITLTRDASIGDLLAQYYLIWVLRIGFTGLLYHLGMFLWTSAQGKYYVLEGYPWLGLGLILGTLSLLLGAFHHWHNEYYEPRLLERILNDPKLQSLARRYGWEYDETGERYLGSFEGMDLVIAPRVFTPEGYWLEVGVAPAEKTWNLAELPRLRKPYEYYFHQGSLMLTTRVYLSYWKKILPESAQLQEAIQDLGRKLVYVQQQTPSNHLKA